MTSHKWMSAINTKPLVDTPVWAAYETGQKELSVSMAMWKDDRSWRVASHPCFGWTLHHVTHWCYPVDRPEPPAAPAPDTFMGIPIEVAPRTRDAPSWTMHLGVFQVMVSSVPTMATVMTVVQAAERYRDLTGHGRGLVGCITMPPEWLEVFRAECRKSTAVAGHGKE